MTITTNFLDAVALTAERFPAPLVIPWPAPDKPDAVLSFASFAEWRDFVMNLSLHVPIPETVRAKFERAQKLHLLAWIDFDLVKAGEPVALTTLELALTDRYGPKAAKQYGNMTFSHLLRYLSEQD